MILPPKRWERSEGPKYDPIRHRPWFLRLEKRKTIIPQMEQAYAMLGRDGGTQRRFALEFGLRERDFQDFIQFKDGHSRYHELGYNVKLAYLDILNGAYKLYCEHGAAIPIQSFIDDLAPLYGLKGRPVYEMWQVDPTFYPTGYSK